MTGPALLSDQQLISAAQRGDAGAFSELVCRNRDQVLAAVYRMCGDRALAEEAAQEAFIRVWQHLPRYREGHSFRAWLYRIAINAALDRLRRERPVVDIHEEGLALPDAHGDPAREMEKRERAQRVQRAVMALTPPYRAVLVLREYGDLSYAEIAAALEIPLGTVMSRLSTARAQLKPALADLLEVE